MCIANLPHCSIGLHFAHIRSTAAIISLPASPPQQPLGAGDAFFADLPPRDLRADPAAAGELQRRLHVLLGQGCQRCVADGRAGLGHQKGLTA